jgi:membrane-associated phospholipid phosphatase
MRCTLAFAMFWMLWCACGLLGQEGQSGAPSEQPSDVRDVSWEKLAPNVASDQKDIWTFPWRLAHGRYLLPTLAVAGGAAALVALDPHDTPYFRRSTSFHGFNNTFSSGNTSLGILIAPASLYAAGLALKDKKLQSTTLLAGEAVADSEIVATALKYATGRERPSAVQSGGSFSDTWFEKGASGPSFPSGHTIAAFSVATVFARRYGKQHRWVPWVAYGGAALVGLSRVTSAAHFPSDVFMGAALGYSISRFAVLRQ